MCPTAPPPLCGRDQGLQVEVVVMVAVVGLEMVSFIVDWMVRTLGPRGVGWWGWGVKPSFIRGPAGGERS